ncbi:unnamed protein product [marine sediment metagenome]|uniref:Uncharacterized protein n=1 Tax=marine sediment metagenome TaxID=412755 RepID=X1T1D4_9ZZZZ
MLEIHLLILQGHKPSEISQKIVEFWLKDIPSITMTTSCISTRMEMLSAKHEHKFETLPCLIVNDTLTRSKAQKFYHDSIRAKAEDIKKKHPPEKRRKYVQRMARDINGR